jgi:hypothetical protein
VADPKRQGAPQFKIGDVSGAAEIRRNRERQIAAKTCDGFRVVEASAKIVSNQFHNTVLCERRTKRGTAQVSDTCFGVHFFAENSIVNSPLHRWVLNGECKRLWKSLSARVKFSFTVARRACAITKSHLIQFVENILLSRTRYGVNAHGIRLPRRSVWEFVPPTLSGRLDAFLLEGTDRRFQKIKKQF